MVDYKDLNYDLLQTYMDKEIIIRKNGVNYYFKLSLDRKFRTVVVFSNGALDRTKKAPPVYMRSNWTDEIQANCIYIDDPTVHNSELSIGWGIGRPEVYYLSEISGILKKILALFGYDDSCVFYYGSSAGGTMSLMLSSMHLGSKAIVNNPQIHVDKFLSGRTISDIKETFFAEYSIEEFKNKYKLRLSVPYSFKLYENVPKTLYLFNRLAYGDFGIHYKALIDDSKLYDLDLSNLIFIMYNKKELGHNPISKDMTITYINNFIHHPDLWI